jgi:hypothetical protein
MPSIVALPKYTRRNKTTPTEIPKTTPIMVVNMYPPIFFG